ncbi:unnamed protein product [Tilletia controversa]|nr:unnamed protein product [Tilletia controversa]
MKTYTSSRKVKNKQRLRREHPVPACDAGAFMTIGQELCGEILPALIARFAMQTKLMKPSSSAISTAASVTHC